MSESIIRGGRKGFTTIYNSALQDPRLSLKTIGLFAIMQSFPENWEYSVSGLAVRVRIGRDAVRKCLKELEDAGYLIREQLHQGNGKFGGTVYTLLSEAPPEKAPPPPPKPKLPPEPPLTENPSTVRPAEKKAPLTEKPSTVLPLTGNHPQVKKHLSKETSSNNPVAPKGARPSMDLFERFWAAYPKQQNRAAALRAWSKLRPDDDLFRVMEAALRWQKETEQWRREGGRYIPAPAAWLRGRRWEDQPVKLGVSNEWMRDIIAKRNRDTAPFDGGIC